MAVNREWPPEYRQKQHQVIRWMAEQGYTPEEIATATWGMADETTRALRMTRKVTTVQYDLKTHLLQRDEHEKTFYIPLKGTEHEHFLLKSRIYCGWMFTRERPRSWRKEKSRNSLYTPDEIRQICGKLAWVQYTSVLTETDLFANIEVSRLNITKMKTKELKDKARTPE